MNTSNKKICLKSQIVENHFPLDIVHANLYYIYSVQQHFFRNILKKTNFPK